MICMLCYWWRFSEGVSVAFEVWVCLVSRSSLFVEARVALAE